MVDRRNFLKNASWLGLGTLGVVSGCTPGKKAMEMAEKNYQIYLNRLQFPKIKVSLDRVVKETVGLRPFRTKGPRVVKEELGSKQLVHNYGHGGSGWSLSWGSSNRAVKLALSSGADQYAVLGCGVMGLTTATLLQKYGKEVTIYAKDLPPQVTSSKATGTWSPSHYLIDDENIDDAFMTRWKEDCRFSFLSFQNLLGTDANVEWTDSYLLRKSIQASGESSSNRFHIPDQLPNASLVPAQEHPFRGWAVQHTPRLIFNIPLYLQSMMDRFVAFGGKIKVQEIKKPEDADALPEKCLVNCMGLGSKAVFNDEHLIPVSGQLSFLIPQPEIRYMLMTPEGYSIPRRDGIILGGDHIRGSWSTEPRKEQTEKVVEALRAVTEEMAW